MWTILFHFAGHSGGNWILESLRHLLIVMLLLYCIIRDQLGREKCYYARNKMVTAAPQFSDKVKNCWCGAHGILHHVEQLHCYIINPTMAA
ncbi:hypothetical protein GUJ93_ZPchr0002g26520 [Zizania palustris]|uniref:Uncharacterized protein n=1 Tax=Zizania palustris TaxID=103762 RepID=A0A8J5SNK1_ZIZPA|nr:hypothetical protein GUJ93_ZPchr0002g26520 [Zizania palustris]